MDSEPYNIGRLYEMTGLKDEARNAEGVERRAETTSETSDYSCKLEHSLSSS